MASGDVQIGVIGSSPLAAAVSRGLDLQLFWILDDINEAEALVVRNGIGHRQAVTDLKGKKLGVALRVDRRTSTPCSRWSNGASSPSERQVAEHAAQPDRGGLGARRHRRRLRVGSGARRRSSRTARCSITSGELSKKGKADLRRHRRQPPWAEANKDFMAKFVKAMADADAAYRANPAEWSPTRRRPRRSPARSAASRRPVADALKLYAYPDAERADVARLARRRPGRRRGQGAEGDGGLPEGAEAHRRGGPPTTASSSPRSTPKRR